MRPIFLNVSSHKFPHQNLQTNTSQLAITNEQIKESWRNYLGAGNSSWKLISRISSAHITHEEFPIKNLWKESYQRFKQHKSKTIQITWNKGKKHKSISHAHFQGSLVCSIFFWVSCAQEPLQQNKITVRSRQSPTVIKVVFVVSNIIYNLNNYSKYYLLWYFK